MGFFDKIAERFTEKPGKKFTRCKGCNYPCHGYPVDDWKAPLMKKGARLAGVVIAAAHGLPGGGLWYALIVTIFKEKINVNSSDDYNKLLREKAEIEEKYKIKCSEIITLDNNKHILDEKLEKLENKNDVIEKRYIWMLEQLKDLVLSDNISLEEKEKVVRIMNDSAHIN